MTRRLASRRAAAGALGVALVLGASACSDDDDARRGRDGQVTEEGSMSVYDLLEGDCMRPPEDVSVGVERVTVMPCADPHTQEVFALLEFKPVDGGEDFPGDDEIQTYAEAACLDPFAEYVGIDYIDSSLFLTFLTPTVRSWNEEGDREIICIAQTDGGELDGSVRDSAR